MDVTTLGPRFNFWGGGEEGWSGWLVQIFGNNSNESKLYIFTKN
jgi:hypothetical protein